MLKLIIYFIAILLISQTRAVALDPTTSTSFSSRFRCSSTFQSKHHNHKILIEALRGGSDEDYIDEDALESSDGDEVDSLSVSTALKAIKRDGGSSDTEEVEYEVSTKSVGGTLGKITKFVFRRIKAASLSLFSDASETNDDEIESSSFPVKILKGMSRFVKTLLLGEASSELGEIAEYDSDDFAKYLKDCYDVEVPDRGDDIILSGNLASALHSSRAKARLLVCFLPAYELSKMGKKCPDLKTAKGIGSPEVIAAADYKGGSFMIWGTKGGSSEAVSAVKRIKATSRKNTPVLAVVYPAQIIDGSGRPKIVAKLLAQHHCNPPPSAPAMASWLKALRKRHSKQIKIMQRDLKEQELYLERKEGYESSIIGDKKREKIEAAEIAEKDAKEQAEKKRLEELEQRRKQFLESLPDEPAKGEDGVITVALRFADGRNGQRRFTSDDDASIIFNWIDAIFKIERENIILTTMNGKKTFILEDDGDVVISEWGLGKMTGLRVSEKEGKKEEDEDKETEDESKI